MNVTGMSVITNMGAVFPHGFSHEEVTEAGLAVRDELVLVKAVVVASQSW